MLALTFGDVLLIWFFATIPIAVLSFALGARYSKIGKGRFGMFHDERSRTAPATRAVRDAEVREMLEARAYRQGERGETPIDVDAEMENLSQLGGSLPSQRLRGRKALALRLKSDPELVAEVRDVVLALNERRVRRGQEPLDVEAETERLLYELESLGE